MSALSVTPESAVRAHPLANSELFVVVRWLPSGELIYVSPSAESVFGIPVEQLMRFRAGELLKHSREGAEVERRVGLLRPGRRCVTDDAFRLPDGSDRWLTCETTAYFEDGEIAYIETVGFETTARHKAVHMAVIHEQRLKNVLEHLTDIVLLVDDSSTIVWVCPSIERELGRDPRLVRERSNSLLGSGTRAKLDAAVQEVLAGGHLAERRLRTSVMGECGDHLFELLFINMVDVAGINAVMIHGHDVTAREQVERGKFEAYLRELLSDVREFVLHLDTAGTIKYASPSYEEYGGKDSVGDQLADSLPTDDRAALDALLTDVTVHRGRRVVTRVPVTSKGDTTPHWVELTARLIPTDSAPRGCEVVVVGRILARPNDAHLAVVAQPAATSVDDVVSAIRAMSPAEKLSVIDALRRGG